MHRLVLRAALAALLASSLSIARAPDPPQPSPAPAESEPAESGPAAIADAIPAPFEIDGRRVDRAVVTLDRDLPPAFRPGATPPAVELDSPMLRRLQGVLADLHGGQLAPLRAALPRQAAGFDAPASPPICTIHLFAGQAARVLDIHRLSDGRVLAVDRDAPPGRRPYLVDRAVFAALWLAWPVSQGIDPAAIGRPAAREAFAESAVALTAPGYLWLDQPTLSSRITGGVRWDLPTAQRVLADERLAVRLPRGHHAAFPSGLLVWVSPTPNGIPPAHVHDVCDELGLVAVGVANAGNDRLAADRMQVVLDATQTALERHHIDPRRVYVTGFSGGGRISSMLVGCVPDVYAGAVCIGGINCFDRVPDGVGSYWAPGFARPTGPLWTLLKSRRIAAITGTRDFNQRQTQNAVRIYDRAGIPVRLWDLNELAHELPPPAVWAEAIRWVDAPHRHRRAKEESAATALLEQARARGQPDDAARRLLVRATAEGPWSPAAWSAAQILLGHADLSAGAAASPPPTAAPATPPRSP